jgi:hypothetical protein
MRHAVLLVEDGAIGSQLAVVKTRSTCQGSSHVIASYILNYHAGTHHTVGIESVNHVETITACSRLGQIS